MSTKIPAGIKAIHDKDGTVRGYRVRVDAGMKPDGTRRQVCSTHRTPQEARAALDATRVQIRTGAYTPRDKVTVGVYLDRWLDGKRNLRATTAAGYKYDLKPARDAFANTLLQRLSKSDVDGLVRTMQTTGGRSGKGRSARTISLMLTLLQQALDAAVRERLVSQNVAALVERPRGEPTVVGKAWSPEQARRFLAVAGQDRYAAAWRLSLCGLRRGEVLGLTWSAVDLDKGTARVDASRVLLGGHVVTNAPKTKAGVRTIPLLAEVVADLRTLRRVQAAERLAAGPGYEDRSLGLVFVDPAGIPLRPEAYADEFHRLTRVARLPKIRLHDLRHTAASWLASLGVPPAVAAALLGHDVAVYLRTYVHPYEADKRDAMERLGAAFRASG